VDRPGDRIVQVQQANKPHPGVTYTVPQHVTVHDAFPSLPQTEKEKENEGAKHLPRGFAGCKDSCSKGEPLNRILCRMKEVGYRDSFSSFSSQDGKRSQVSGVRCRRVVRVVGLRFLFALPPISSSPHTRHSTLASASARSDVQSRSKTNDDGKAGLLVHPPSDGVSLVVAISLLTCKASVAVPRHRHEQQQQRRARRNVKVDHSLTSLAPPSSTFLSCFPSAGGGAHSALPHFDRHARHWTFPFRRYPGSRVANHQSLPLLTP